MQNTDYLSFLVNQIHTVIMATVDESGLPVTCAIDMMDFDEGGLYFLTARGKGFYHRLTQHEYIALTGIKGEDTMSRIALSIRGKVQEIGAERLPKLFEKNSYMHEIYPTEQSRQALTVFRIYDGNGEWFDLSKKPIERVSFAFGKNGNTKHGYVINDNCIGCKSCLNVCPQNCIDTIGRKMMIRQENCLHCGNCLNICSVHAVEKRG